MFRNTRAFSSFSVNDLARAKDFYGDVLGLDIKEVEEGLEIHLAGGQMVFVYAKPNHVPATFTILNFPVDNIDRAVNQLISRDIRFEHYDGEMQTDEKGIFRGPGPRIAWFKDPAGNFLSVLEPK